MKVGVERVSFLPKRTPSFNAFKGKHWSNYHNESKSWMGYCIAFIGRGAHNDKFRNIMIKTYHRGSTRYDRDNHIGGCKPLIDSLKKLGWMKDDSPKWLNVIYRQGSVGDDGVLEPGTVVTIYTQEWRPIRRERYFCYICMSEISSRFPALATFICGEGYRKSIMAEYDEPCAECGRMATQYKIMIKGRDFTGEDNYIINENFFDRQDQKEAEAKGGTEFGVVDKADIEKGAKYANGPFRPKTQDHSVRDVSGG